jgi:hypothetical protein
MGMRLVGNQSEVVKQYPSFRSSDTGGCEETFGGYHGFKGSNRKFNNLQIRTTGAETMWLIKLVPADSIINTQVRKKYF